MVLGTVTEHLLVWDGDDALPAGIALEEEEVEDEVVEGSASCNTRKDRY